MRFALGLVAGAALAITLPALALACETYVVDGQGPGWQPAVVLAVEVSRVDRAGPDLIDRNPVRYGMTVTDVLRGAGIPRAFEVGRANGCDSMNLLRGDRLVVAVGKGDGLTAQAGAGQGGPDNYNSAWYRVLGGGRLRLVPGSSWVDGQAGDTTVDALLRATEAAPATNTEIGQGGHEPPWNVALIAGLLGAWVVLRRARQGGSRRASRN